ncbi:hypothetical protein NPIL_85701 [Nephila pilipes]|uniref:Transposase n=1 Tax=Nephila pilipes TaxID=299642 RepID=A0A8X6QPI5_NEPPI|nr:hypothetical protein NPIL_85701 [Nephila pilipes]
MRLQKAKRASIAFKVGVSQCIVQDWMSFCREMCMDMRVFESSTLGGPSEIMEIDENMFGKCKYNRVKRANGSWVLVGVQRSSNNFFTSLPADRRIPFFNQGKKILKQQSEL